MTTPLPLEPPDTSEAVARIMVIDFADYAADIQDTVVAHHKALAEKGWTVAPVVKVTPEELWAGVKDAGPTDIVRFLQSLGLPIELES